MSNRKNSMVSKMVLTGLGQNPGSKSVGKASGHVLRLPGAARGPSLGFPNIHGQDAQIFIFVFFSHNAVVLKPGEKGGNRGLVQSKLAQGELDQGELAPSKPAQEELAQSGLAQEATGVVEEGENKEEMEGAHAGDCSSGPMDKGIQAEGGHGSSVQQQPQQEVAMSEGTKSLQAGDFQSHTRFTQSQLQDLEHLFEENHFPSFQVRKALARSMGVTEEDVQDWFRTRRAIFRRSNRMVVLIDAPPGPQSNDP
ncbi:uncharacterized protein LOC143270811 isoform X1 [Peromyscus maniculatus bairdii]|uniref:uncharacterized protein LOC143270671 isoform X1 n=1 Tax=Peromyscus maniculatus bairdii TaxID=230844 RepID=UPI003FD3F3FB